MERRHKGADQDSGRDTLLHGLHYNMRVSSLPAATGSLLQTKNFLKHGKALPRFQGLHWLEEWGHERLPTLVYGVVIELLPRQ